MMSGRAHQCIGKVTMTVKYMAGRCQCLPGSGTTDRVTARPEHCSTGKTARLVRGNGFQLIDVAWRMEALEIRALCSLTAMPVEDFAARHVEVIEGSQSAGAFFTLMGAAIMQQH